MFAGVGMDPVVRGMLARRPARMCLRSLFNKSSIEEAIDEPSLRQRRPLDCARSQRKTYGQPGRHSLPMQEDRELPMQEDREARRRS